MSHRFHHHRDAVRARLREWDHRRAGPGSITWRVNREVIVIAGWGRAILLQLAHPAIAAGVHDHSSVRGCPLSSLRRLRSTIGGMLSITFGDTEQMIAAVAGIHSLHDRVRGTIPPAPGLRAAGTDGADRRYSAHDPELQRWVHATLLDSIHLAYERLVGPLTLSERDQYCVEASIMEPLMGMPPGWLPRTSAELDGYMCGMLSGGSLVVTDTSRALARLILYPPRWRMAWPAFRPIQLLTIGSLPAPIREAYGFDWQPRDARALARWTSGLRASRRLMPRFAREWPMAARRENAANEGPAPAGAAAAVNVGAEETCP